MKTTRIFKDSSRSLWAACLTLGISAALSPASFAANEVAHWNLDQTASPYTNADNAADPLVQDTGTSTAGTAPGISGNGAVLQFANPGPSTRLFAANDGQTSNSFGFSFFIKANSLNAFDSFMQKETNIGGGNGFDDTAWQVHLTGANNGQAAVELVIRGENNGFAGVSSMGMLTLGAASNDFVNIAGGYNAATGVTTLFLRDMTTQTVAEMQTATGSTGLITNDSAAFSLGTGKQNGNAVDFAASTLIDDVRIFDAPLTAADVAGIEAAAVPEPSQCVSVLILAGVGLFTYLRHRNGRGTCLAV